MDVPVAPPGHSLRLLQRASFGLGHVLNDLCASMWFSYLLLYFQNVIGFSNSLAGYLMLLGQVVDAICTPFVGYESDRTNGCGKYGKRKSWHLLGSICVACSFPFLFMLCIGCAASANWALFIYYAPFVVIFQFGWAATQIAHLSLIPELTPIDGERVELNALRYAFTVMSNIFVYCIAWALLSTVAEDGHPISQKDAATFRVLVLIVVSTGILFSFLFHLGTREKSLASRARDAKLLQENHISVMEWKDWLKEYQFYQVAVIYMCTRLIINVSQIYMPMYVTHTLKMKKYFVAIIPLVVFVSGFVVSLVMKLVNKVIGRKPTYFVGCLGVLAGCVLLQFLTSDSSKGVFGAAVLLGLGGSTLLITSLSMTADLIGTNTESGAFVYGAMSFTDKLSNGGAVLLVQHFHPCNAEQSACCPACVWYYKDVMVFIPGAVTALAILILLTLIPVTIGQLQKDGQLRVRVEEGPGQVQGQQNTEVQDERSPLIG